MADANITKDGTEGKLMNEKDTEALSPCEGCGSTRIEARHVECEDCGFLVSFCSDCGAVLETCDCEKYVAGLIPKVDDESDDDLEKNEDSDEDDDKEEEDEDDKESEE